MPWYFLFSPYSTRSQTKQFCSIYSSFHGTWGHVKFEKRSRKPSVKCWNFTHDEWRKRQNKHTRLELKYYCWYCWVAFNYAPSFYFRLEMFSLRSILWPNLASSRVTIAKTCRWHRVDNSNLKGLFCLKGWNVLLAMEWMKTKQLCHGSSFSDYQGHKHLPVF